MLSNSMFLPGNQQLLQQKVQILQEELQQYKMKQSRLSKLNQSILQTYKLNQTQKYTQQQQIKKQHQQLITKHREEIRKLKTQFIKDKTQLQSENNQLKQKVKLLEDIMEKVKLQNEQQVIDLKITLENKHKKDIQEIENKYQKQIEQTNQQMTQKIQDLEQYLEDLEHQNSLYQEYIQRKQDQQKENNPKIINSRSNLPMKSAKIFTQNNQDRSNLKNHKSKPCQVQYQLYPQLMKQPSFDQQNTNQKYQIKTLPKESKKLISELSTKINKAIKEINQNNCPRHY